MQLGNGELYFEESIFHSISWLGFYFSNLLLFILFDVIIVKIIDYSKHYFQQFILSYACCCIKAPKMLMWLRVEGYPDVGTLGQTCERSPLASEVGVSNEGSSDAEVSQSLSTNRESIRAENSLEWLTKAWLRVFSLLSYIGRCQNLLFLGP